MPGQELAPEQFEKILGGLCDALTKECQAGARFETSSAFEKRVREILSELLKPYTLEIDFAPHPHVFPDIVLRIFGVEVKFTLNDTWRSVANSIFEGTRSKDVQHIYVLFGKMGGAPEVKWGKYEECVIHVRTSHVPRFEVEMDSNRKPLFEQMGVPYDEFSSLALEERMKHVRKYARSRLEPGERLWWLEDMPDQGHSLPIQVRLYMDLPMADKLKLRAEAAILCPQIVKEPRAKHKYDDAAIYLLTYHGVLCSQVRDLFSAGSVAMRSDATRGGRYILRALKDIESKMAEVAPLMEDALFVEYWEMSVPPGLRIKEWLRRADELAVGWRPSKHLFLGLSS